VVDDRIYRVAVTGYHLKNCEASFGVSLEELRSNGREMTISTSVSDVLTEYFADHPNPSEPEAGRIVIEGGACAPVRVDLEHKQLRGRSENET
jgi:hypothetical protein